MVNVREKKTILVQVKEAFKTMVANFDRENSANSSFWGQTGDPRRHSRRDDYDRRHKGEERIGGRNGRKQE